MFLLIFFCHIVFKMVLPGTLYTVKGFTRALKESQYHVNLYIAELMGKAQEQNTGMYQTF